VAMLAIDQPLSSAYTMIPTLVYQHSEEELPLNHQEEQHHDEHEDYAQKENEQQNDEQLNNDGDD